MKLFFILSILASTILSQDLTINALENIHQNNGNRTYETLVAFPENVSEYSQIKMRIHLNCPNGGCDPWDRKAYISVENFDEWIEIGRYVTPYGVSCGWEIDVTDFKSILHGNVKLKSHIDTWVNPGWLVNIDFDYFLGNSEFEYFQVRNVWNRGQVVYGDPTQPVEISNFNEYIFSDVEAVKLKITTTGHGQGNTNNAAEFSNMTHDIVINENNIIPHNFWRNDCAQNECSPQSGTWQYSRAGFCPGDVSLPIEFDLTPYLNTGVEFNLQYILEDYINYCSPNNDDCVNGQNGCSVCDYNQSTHTEPFYFISSQLIQYSNNYHSNADVYLKISELDEDNQTISIYMENSVPVYGVQFEINTDDLNPLNPPYNYEMTFGNPIGGRASEVGWTMEINELGTLVGLSFSGEFIPTGEGILTEVNWSVETNSPMEGEIHLEVDEISGYFGESLKVETGEGIEIVVLGTHNEQEIPISFTIFNAYPNPFNPETKINFYSPQSIEMDINIIDLNGELIHVVHNGYLKQGYHSKVWNASNFPSGVYLIQFSSIDFYNSQKIVLLK